jgi:sugar O-acyltransferase (sialic acid O-acetyltransferase NeuD family)
MTVLEVYDEDRVNIEYEPRLVIVTAGDCVTLRQCSVGLSGSMKLHIIGIGAGGHARVLIEILQLDSRFEVVGLLDPKCEVGTQVLGIPVLGDDEELPRLMREGIRHFFLGVGSVGDSLNRRRLYEKAVDVGMQPVSTIHPSAIISPSASVGKGLMIMAGAIVNAGATLGCNIIVNTAAVIEHDCTLGDHVHIATGAHLASGVRVGRGAHIGAGAVVRQCVTIDDGAVIGVGAAVVKDVGSGTIVAGVPARVLRGGQGI